MQVLILVNPRAGNNEGERWLKALRDHFRGQGGELRAVVLRTQVGGVLQQLHAKAESADRVIVVGGDGTASAVIHGLSAMRRSIPVGVIPLGTGNDLARSLNLHHGRPWTLQEAIRYVRSSRTQWVDIWSLNGRLTFNNYLSVGLDAQIVRDFSRIRRWIQARPLWGRRGLYFTVYFLVGLRHVRSRVPPGSRLVWMDAQGVERFLYLRAPRVLALSNTPYYAAGALMDSGGAVGDRLLEATIFPHLRSYVELLAMRVPTFARWGIQKRWRRIQARQLEIQLSEPTSVQADGEDVTGHMGGARVLYIGPLGQIPILLRD